MTGEPPEKPATNPPEGDSARETFFSASSSFPPALPPNPEPDESLSPESIAASSKERDSLPEADEQDTQDSDEKKTAAGAEDDPGSGRFLQENSGEALSAEIGADDNDPRDAPGFDDDLSASLFPGVKKNTGDEEESVAQVAETDASEASSSPVASGSRQEKQSASAGKAHALEEPAEIAEWVHGDAIASASTIPASSLPGIRPPAVVPLGPGLVESLGWMGGVFVLQIIGGMLGALLAGVLYLQRVDEGMTAADHRFLNDPQNVRHLLQEHQDVIFAVAQGVMLIAALAAVAWRLGPQRRRLLSLRPMSKRHLLLIMSSVLPLSLLAMQLYQVGDSLWEYILRQFPQTEILDDVDSVSTVRGLTGRTPLLMMVLIIACAPAIWEELVFRGTIGRGLTARYGLMWGVGLTSLLFAVMHLNPPHVFALLPLSVFLHLAYLATRSFWAPVLLHFFNNALAVLLLQWIEDSPATPAEMLPADTATFSPQLMGVAALCLLLLLRVLWRSRTEFIQPDGTIWTPGYVTAESPPASLNARARCRPVVWWEWILAAGGLILFLIVVSSRA